MSTECYPKSNIPKAKLDVLIDIATRVNDTHICFSGDARTIARSVIRDGTNVQLILQRLKLGDKVFEITQALKIPHCKSCAKRRKVLNGEA